MMPTLQISIAQRYLNYITKSKGRDQKLSVEPDSPIQFLSAPPACSQPAVLGAAPGTVTSTMPSGGRSGHQPDPQTVTLIYSKPGSQENQTEFEHMKTKVQHIHIKKLFSDAKSYKLQALQTANTIQAQQVQARSFSKRSCRKDRKGLIICRGSFGVAKEHERGSVLN